MSKVFNMVGGGGGPAASIFVTGLSETDTVTATKGAKTLTGKWVTKTKFGKVPLIPTMTSNTTPSGTASLVNGTTTETPAYLAFDGDDSTYAYSTSSSFPRGIQYKFDTAQTFTSVYIKWTPWTNSNLKITCVLQTSMNGSTWTTHDTETVSFSSTSEVFERTFELGNVTAQYIRYVVTNISNTSSGGMPNFCTMQAYYDGVIQVSGFEISNIRDMGTWTVTATNGEKTATQDVLVDAITEYDIEMGYKLWLYKDGDPCEDVTGGWSQKSVSGKTDATVTMNETNISWYQTPGQLFRLSTNNAVDFTGYSKLVFQRSQTVEKSGSYDPVIIEGACSNPSATPITMGNEGTVASKDPILNTSFSTTDVEIDVSGVTGSYYVYIRSDQSDYSGLTISGVINKVWLE